MRINQRTSSTDFLSEFQFCVHHLLFPQNIIIASLNCVKHFLLNIKKRESNYFMVSLFTGLIIFKMLSNTLRYTIYFSLLWPIKFILQSFIVFCSHVDWHDIDKVILSLQRESKLSIARTNWWYDVWNWMT